MATSSLMNPEGKSNFDKQKARVLATVDLSRKGSIDSAVVELIKALNDHVDLVTLSSCSGRTVVLRESIIHSKVQKKGCTWILVKHEPLEKDELWNQISETPPTPGILTFKFEPFILHLQVRSLDLAKKLHTVSLECGFKNTGLTIGKNNKFVLAVRSTHGLEIPLSDKNGEVLISKSYCDLITELANDKMKRNEEKYTKFYDEIKKL